MKNRTIEKMLYKVAALLAVVGIILRVVQPSDNYLGLYLILAGHILGVMGILMYMKHTTDLERGQKAPQKPEQQLQKK